MELLLGYGGTVRGTVEYWYLVVRSRLVRLFSEFDERNIPIEARGGTATKLND